MKYFRKPLVILLILTLIIQGSIQAKAQSSNDYLNITLADIIMAWYNASGVAIGNSQLANAIYDLYGNVTLENLVDNNVIKSHATTNKEEIKESIGYGNLSVPTIYVSTSALKSYLGDVPTSSVAKEALDAMFTWENTPVTEGIFAALGVLIGDVANIGKIAYNVALDVIEDVSKAPPIQSLLDVYRNFTDSTYFQDLINKQTVDEYYLKVGVENWPANWKSDGINKWAALIGNNIAFVSYSNEDTVPVYYVSTNGDMVLGFYNPERTAYYNAHQYASVNGYEINNNTSGRTYNTAQNQFSGIFTSNSRLGSSYIKVGYCLVFDTTEFYSANDTVKKQMIIERLPISDGEQGTGGVTDYINSEVGNLTAENYQEQNPNIKNNEYMYIFNRPTYETIIGEITQNTNNGTITNNGDIITNYNNTYIQNSTVPDVRPSTAPAPSEQPAQPFISPRPTVPPDVYESVVYDGSVPETIKNKFPFCIPWDLKALVDGLWSPTRKAPYIHWDATFGSWGKLGEIDIDLSEFDTVAQIHRSIILLLWILGLVIITKNLIS